MAAILGLVTKTTRAFLEVNSISVDNWTFKFFYKATTTLLIGASILVTSRQFFGNPIVCDAGSAKGGIQDDVLESYCWMYAHFKIPPEYKGPCSGQEQDDIEGPIYNSYYQWIPIFLIFLAVLFYSPRCLWIIMEGGLMKFFGKGTTSRLVEEPEEKREKLVKFFSENIHNKFNIYYFGFIFCEFLNLFVVLVSFMLTHRFLNYRFLSYGISVWIYYRMPPEEQRMSMKTNPMCYTFPRIAACDYHRFGSGGAQENINAICILALNIINDKVFLLLWWWFMVLTFLGICRLIFRLIQVNSARLRFQMLNLRMHRYFKHNENMKKIRDYVYQCSRGDWFVIYQLSKNLNRPFFMDFLVTLTRTLDPSPKLETVDTGDGILEMMIKPNLRNFDSEKNDNDEDV